MVVLDFDDMTVGPAIQDLALLHYGANGAGPGTTDSRRALRERFAAGYRELRPLSDRAIALAEPLLALRMPFWDAWAASNAYDPRFAAEIGERVTAEGVALRVRRMHEGLRLVAQA